MTHPAQALIDFQPTQDYLVAIDSDGCAFDAMGIKQSECFCPMMIGYFGLQPVADAARECKMFADLFSRTRGANRHKTIVRILTELLPAHPKVKQRGFQVPRFDHYAAWVNNPQSMLSDAGLKKAISETSSPQARQELEQVLKWSMRVNEMVAEIVRDVPPFLFVRESLQKAAEKADIIVCSATPTDALEREWTEHGLARYVKVVAGQEMGSKAEHLAIVSNGKYRKDRVVMLGDALGDRDAAAKNGVLFYAINPGDENASWKRFYKEVFDLFIAGRYAGAAEQAVIASFEQCMPEHPSW